jgi:hypothetical protein
VPFSASNKQRSKNIQKPEIRKLHTTDRKFLVRATEESLPMELLCVTTTMGNTRDMIY